MKTKDMTPKRTKTVKGVGVYSGDGKFLFCIETYGRYGDNFSKESATSRARLNLLGGDYGRVLVPCTITFQLPNRRTNTKGKK